jgi:DNA-binding Lrp family transcriptional regulator
LSPDNVIALLHGVPEIVGCFRISGDADLMVMISSTTPERLQDICEPIWRSVDVKTTKTTVVLKSYLGTSRS